MRIQQTTFQPEPRSNALATHSPPELVPTDMDSPSDPSNSTLNEPRSRRVGLAGPPPNFQLLPTSAGAESQAAPSSPPPPTSPAPSTSPPLPPRSPLRPPARSYTEATPPKQSYSTTIHEEPEEDMSLMHSRSFGSFSSALDSKSRSMRPKTPDKPLPLPPPSPVSLDDSDQEDTLPMARPRTSSREDSSVPLSKRTHALLELLSSERAYASDLALIRDIHIPLALGQPAPFQATPITPPPSSGSSSRTLSTASDSSSGSTPASPMTIEDARKIFNNVAELAFFSDIFTEKLEEALGGVLEDGEGEDHVGKLFLDTIPEMEPLYTAYITKHPAALEHLNKLPQTPALVEYLSHTHELAQSLTHAWDLPSLLIKPVQRLMKYSLLLKAIISETPESHGDKENLKQARAKMEEVAHGVNEGRRRREVVKEVLTGTPPMKIGDQKTVKKKGLNVGVAASVNLGRMRSLRAPSASLKAKEGAEANQEAEQVKEMGAQLKHCDTFMRHFAKDTVRWAESLIILMESLRDWTNGFGRVIGITEEHNSEAFDAFLLVIEERLLPICIELSKVIEQNLLPRVSLLEVSLRDPERLLEAMDTLEPLHYTLLNYNVSKSRPPTQMLEASKAYVALRAQLSAELPRYLALLHNGLSFCIREFISWQTEVWTEIQIAWSDLWEALRVDGEMQGEASETLRVWWSRYAEVEANMQNLNIIRSLEKTDRHKTKTRMRSSSTSMEYVGPVAVSVLTALDPPHAVQVAQMSQMMPPPLRTPPAMAKKTRSVQSLEYGSRRPLEERISNESLHSKRSGKSSGMSSHRYAHSNASNPFEDMEFDGTTLTSSSTASLVKPSYQRTKSIPISLPMQLKKTSSHGRLLDAVESSSASSSTRSLIAHDPQDEDDRGRPVRKPSFKRRLTESLRPSPAPSGSRHRRSPSLPISKPLGLVPSPSPSQSSFGVNSQRQGGVSASQIPPMYDCRVIINWDPPLNSSYQDLPFFRLRRGEIYHILQESGHPRTHLNFPVHFDGGEDCLLLVRDRMGDIGWALASYMLPK